MDETRFINSPDHTDVQVAVSKVKELCVNICLDCLQGSVICRDGHKRHWAKKESAHSASDWDDDIMDVDNFGNDNLRTRPEDVPFFPPDPSEVWHSCEYPGYWEDCW